MDIKAYVYIDSNSGTMCFHCAVKEIIEVERAFFEVTDTPKYLLQETKFDLTLEMGDTGSGNDMRSVPRCIRCNKRIEDHYIA